MAKRLDNNAILSITATIVSICALFVAAYQTIIMRQQQSASVWPKLVFTNAYFVGGNFYNLTIRNVGIGPAVIKETKITYRDKTFTDLGEYGNHMLRADNSVDSIGFDHSDLSPESVIPQGEKYELFSVSNSKRGSNIFIENIKQFNMTVIFESIYGERWQVHYPYRKAVRSP